MQVSVENGEGLERKMTISVPCKEVDSSVNSRLHEAAGKVRLDGFRAGKVPFKVVKSRFGKGVREEVIGELMNRSVFDAFNQESLQPAGQPKIEPINTKEGEDLQFAVIFEVYPEVNLPDFSQIQVEQPVAEITKDDLSSMIETLREQRRTWEDVERSAEDKDLVNIDYVGKKGGEEFEGGAAKGSNLVLGSKQMIPGFESGIIGKKLGEQFTVALRFPKEYHNAVESGIREAITGGVLAGYPLVDVKVEVVDGSFHEVDSNELAFKMAGIFAVKEACKKANLVLLEPIMKVEVVTPEVSQGDVMGDLNRRRGKILGMEMDSKQICTLTCEVPLAEMFGYATAVRSLSKGRASYSMEPFSFEQVPGNIAEEVISGSTKKPART